MDETYDLWVAYEEDSWDIWQDLNLKQLTDIVTQAAFKEYFVYPASLRLINEVPNG